MSSRFPSQFCLVAVLLVSPTLAALADTPPASPMQMLMQTQKQAQKHEQVQDPNQDPRIPASLPASTSGADRRHDPKLAELQSQMEKTGAHDQKMAELNREIERRKLEQWMKEREERMAEGNAKRDLRPAPQPPSSPTAKKKSFFDRLFRKK